MGDGEIEDGRHDKREEEDRLRKMSGEERIGLWHMDFGMEERALAIFPSKENHGQNSTDLCPFLLEVPCIRKAIMVHKNDGRL